jgi:hypothetical protein
MPLYVDRINTCSILLNGSPILNLYETGSGYCSTVRSGINSEAIGCYSVVSGGRSNTTQARYSTISGGRCNDAGVIGAIDSWNSSYSGSLNTGGPFGPYSPTSASTISGYGAEFEFSFNGVSYNVSLINGGSEYVNGTTLLFDGSIFPSGTTGVDNVTLSNIYVSNYGYATVAGGCRNTASGEYSTISGGYENTTSAYASFIGGGANNTMTTASCYSTIGGGDDNTILKGEVSTIGGGENNTISGFYSTISGGYRNRITSSCATISGGYNNRASGSNSTVSGGYRNTSSGCYSTVSGGRCNTSINGCSAILGGQCNTAQHDCSFIVGSGILSTAANTTHVNCLHFSNIPTSSAGLAPGTVWSDSGMLCIV